MKEIKAELVEQILTSLGGNHRQLREDAIAEGYKDEVCPKEDCDRLFLAHCHFVRCELHGECPMVSETLRHEDGAPKTMLDMFVEQQPA